MKVRPVRPVVPPEDVHGGVVHDRRVGVTGRRRGVVPRGVVLLLLVVVVGVIVDERDSSSSPPAAAASSAGGDGLKSLPFQPLLELQLLQSLLELLIGVPARKWIVVVVIVVVIVWKMLMHQVASAACARD